MEVVGADTQKLAYGETPLVNGQTTIEWQTPAHAKVVKNTVPTGYQAGWEFTLSGTGITPVTGTTDGDGTYTFPTDLGTGNYTITETGMTGWTANKTTCDFTVTLPADSNQTKIAPSPTLPIRHTRK